MRSTFLLIAVAVVFGCAGWATAQMRNWHHQKMIDDYLRQEGVEAELTAKKLAHYLAERVREADEIELIYARGRAGAPGQKVADKHPTRFRDPAWQQRLAESLANGTCRTKPGHSGNVMPACTLRFYKNGTQLLELGHAGALLTVYDDYFTGDFIIGQQTGDAISTLTEAKQINLAEKK